MLTASLEQEIRELRSLMGSPRDPEGRAFVSLADAYRRAGDFRQAVELLREGLERHPDCVPAHLVAAQLYLEKGLLEEAELAARRAVQLDEENVVAWELLAAALEIRGALAQARDARVRLAELQSTAAAEEPGPVAEEEPVVVDIGALAPEEPVVDVGALAPEEPVVDVGALAPEEPVVDVGALAPEEPVVDVNALAPEDLPSDELPESEPLVTRTLAELYARQGLTERALGVFRQLLEISPDDPELLRRVQELEGATTAGLRESEADTLEASHAWTGGAAEQHDELETPFAWTAPAEGEGRPAPEPSIGSYFRKLLAWEPGAGKGSP